MADLPKVMLVSTLALAKELSRCGLAALLVGTPAKLDRSAGMTKIAIYVVFRPPTDCLNESDY